MGFRLDNGAHQVRGEGVREDQGRRHQAQGAVHRAVPRWKFGPVIQSIFLQ